MTQDLAISCSCGTVTGTLHDVGPDEGDRLVCYCSDCRDFIRVLGRAGDVLDDHGGNSVYQTRVAKLELHTGADMLSTLHMTDKPTTRWYASCCNTPFFNTLARAKPPFLSVNTACCDKSRVDAVLGPPKGQFLAEEAEPPIENPKTVSMFKLARGFIPRLLRDVISGDWKKSPLFDPETKEPIASPRRVSPEERATLGEA
ncbi:DUF6151 family protein [Erythrobacter litoralis]|uniref:CENP-V/GFA domain-containing protein n=1 Tax=Erythrobacter litoralis (strain HTCC2594) TaxID=314225 RepID=Q2NAV0_ERYLH|nr:DUF6151 family protein [Erythrobacter litoralis]ABC63191.1 hypothetical protein ELI_05495 [Erythrobacter litoralis HTCC2594]